MKNECNIIRDILPLYAEDMTNPDTAEFVEQHLKTCTECRKEYEHMKEPEANQTNTDVVPLVMLKQKMRTKKIQTIVFTTILVIAVLVSAFAFMDAPEYFPYSPDLVLVTEHTDNSITITFDEKVTDYSCDFYIDPAAEIEAVEEGRYYYQIEAWTSLWDQWFSNRGVQSITIQPEEDLPFTAYYVSNNNEEDVCIYGQAIAENGGVITLPRLALGYYLILAIICFGGLLIVWFAVKRKPNIKIWVERIMLYPVAYVIGHFAVLGFKSTSYSVQRDFLLIIFISILLYCGLLLVHNIFRLRREIEEINGK